MLGGGVGLWPSTHKYDAATWLFLKFDSRYQGEGQEKIC